MLVELDFGFQREDEAASRRTQTQTRRPHPGYSVKFPRRISRSNDEVETVKNRRQRFTTKFPITAELAQLATNGDWLDKLLQ